MARTGVAIDERCLAHDTGPGHPERPERLEVLLDLVRSGSAYIKISGAYRGSTQAPPT